MRCFFQSEWTNKYLAGYNAEARNHASADSVQWQRKGVPLHTVQSQGPMERTLTDIVALAKVLYQEEQKAFHAAMAESADRCGKTASQFLTHMFISIHTSRKGHSLLHACTAMHAANHTQHHHCFYCCIMGDHQGHALLLLHRAHCRLPSRSVAPTERRASSNSL